MHLLTIRLYLAQINISGTISIEFINNIVITVTSANWGCGSEIVAWQLLYYI